MIFNKNNFSGQGTIEYLVIIAIVVVIGLSVVAILTGFLDNTGATSDSSQDISLLTKDIAITEVLLNPTGIYAINLKSNLPKNITITKVSLGDFDQDITVDNKLFLGNKKLFTVSDTESKNCVIGEYVSKKIVITYVTAQGLPKTQEIDNVRIPCQSFVAGVQCALGEFEHDGACIVCENNPDTGEKFAFGSGTEEDPYLICSWEQLSNVREKLNSSFLLKTDLTEDSNNYANFNLSVTGWDPIGDIPYCNSSGGLECEDKSTCEKDFGCGSDWVENNYCSSSDYGPDEYACKESADICENECLGDAGEYFMCQGPSWVCGEFLDSGSCNNADYETVGYCWGESFNGVCEVYMSNRTECERNYAGMCGGSDPECEWHWDEYDCEWDGENNPSGCTWNEMGPCHWDGGCFWYGECYNIGGCNDSEFLCTTCYGNMSGNGVWIEGGYCDGAMSCDNESDCEKPLGCGSDWIVNNFVGNFDGENHTIKGLKINDDSASIMGLFRETGQSGPQTIIKNTILEDIYIMGNNNLGGVSGIINNTLIDNVHVTGNIYGGQNLGGIAGIVSDDSEIKNSTDDVEISPY
ncbi:MAG: hypothetical protein PHX27_00690 [Candidatus ainarchaeum sp.]|nr:hypothetical protein [Candidatus ainarchaeum sp.]